MRLVDSDTTKRKYYYFHFIFFFRSVTILDDLRLAINSERNFTYLRSMFPRGQNYANLCENPASNVNAKVTPKQI